MKAFQKSFRYVPGVFLFLLYGGISIRTTAQTQQPSAVVIEGGTLIDGNGGTPVKDAVVIIQGNKITSVTRKGQGSYPANAQLIKADGKFILPGLWDARVNHVWFVNEPLLMNGVTSIIDMAVGGELQLVHRDAVEHGKIGGPRTFTGAAFIASRPGNRGTGLETSLTPARVAKSVDDARELVKRMVSAGTDMVVLQDGGLSAEIYRTAVEDTHKAGKPLFARPAGPKVDPTQAILAGIDTIMHSGDGLGNFVTKDPSKWGNDAIDAWSDLDEKKADDLAKLVVDHKVSLEPNFVEVAAGLSDKWAHWELEDRRMLSDVSLRAYYPESRALGILGIYSGRTMDSEERARKFKGLMNGVRFHHKVVEAGGHVLVGSDSPSNSAPGTGFHHEMEIFQEGGFTPMQIIQCATKWAAESIRAQNRLGTIEVGKIADVVIVKEDPLQDIKNLQKVDAVIFDGRPVELVYHSWYWTPFLGDSPGGNPPVESLELTEALKRATVRGGGGEGGEGGEGGGRDPGRVPPPGIETISPIIATEGSPMLTLTIKGFNFFRKSQVYFDNIPVPFKRVSGTELQASIDGTLLRRAGRFDITVKNPQPLSTLEWGNGTSNTAHLIVNYKY